MASDGAGQGYPAGMKTAASVPDEITDALNRVVADVGGTIDPFVDQAAMWILENTEW